MFKNARNQAYNQFDPSMTHFDPSVGGRYNHATGDAAGTAIVQAAQGQKMQTNVALNNNAAITLQMELFNWLTSVTRVQNPVYNQGAYHFIPLLTFEGLTAAGSGCVGFKANGDLAMHGTDATPDPIPTIGCQEVAYSSFFEASSISPFQVAYFRYTVNTSAQINNIITWFKKTFSGGFESNPISPRAYFKPTQFQDFVIDITVNFTIGLDSGIYTKVNSGENIQLSLFIEMWTVQGIGQA